MAQLATLRPWPPPPAPPVVPSTACTGVPTSLPLPTNPSPFQLALRTASRRRVHLPVAPHTVPCTCIVPSGLTGPDLDELSWSGRTLTWTRGGSTLYTFTYDQHEQDVAQALFVEWDGAADLGSAASSVGDSPSTGTAYQQASTSATRSDSAPLHPRLFGPYHRPATSSWSDDPLPLPRDPPLPSSPPPPPPPYPPPASGSSSPAPAPAPASAPARPQRALVVLLSTLAFAYPLESSSSSSSADARPRPGGCIPFPLPFRVRRAWALANPTKGGGGGSTGAGLLLERDCVRPTSPYTNGGDTDLGGCGPTWYTLRGPLEPVRPVALRSVGATGRGGLSSDPTTPWTQPATKTGDSKEAVEQEKEQSASGRRSRRKHGLVLLEDPDARIVYVSGPTRFSASSSSLSFLSSSSSLPSVPPPVLVSVNERKRTLRVMRYLPVDPHDAALGAAPAEQGAVGGAVSGDDDWGEGSSRRDHASAGVRAGPRAMGKGKARAQDGEDENDDIYGGYDEHDRSGRGPAASRRVPGGGGGGTKRKHASLGLASAGPTAASSTTYDRSHGHAGLAGLGPAERSVRRASGHGLGYPPPRGASTSFGGPLGPAAATVAASRTLDYQQQQQEHDLLEALTVGAGDVSGSGPGGPPSHSHRPALTMVERRTSTSRNELSVTMDRMALSQGTTIASATNGSSSAAAPLADIEILDREATVLLLNEGGNFVTPGTTDGPGSVRDSECVVETIWEADLGNLSTTGMTAYMFDTRSSTSSSLAIHLPAAQVLLLLSLTGSGSGSDSDTLSAVPLSELQAVSATPMLVTRPDVLDLLYLRPDRSLAVVTADGRELQVPTPALPRGRTIVALESNGASSVLLTLDDGSRQITSFEPLMRNSLATRCLEALAAVLPLDDFVQLQGAVFEQARLPGRAHGVKTTRLRALEKVLDQLFLGSRPASPPSHSPFDQMLDAAADRKPRRTVPLWSGVPLRASGRRPMRNPISTGAGPSPSSSGPPRAQEQAVLLALHLLAQDARAWTGRERDVRILGGWVARFAAARGLVGWVDYWKRLMPSLEVDDDVLFSRSEGPLGHLPASPPDLLSYLAMVLAGKAPSPTAFDLSTFAAQLGLTPSGYYGSTSAPLQRTEQVLALYSHLSRSSSAASSFPPGAALAPISPSARAQRCVLAMHSLGWTPRTLSSALNFAVGVPLREALRTCQLDAPDGWPSGAYELIGRPDLARQVAGDKTAMAATLPADERGASGRTPSIDAIVAQATSGEAAPLTSAAQEPRLTAESGLATVPKAARFNEDKRLEEVARMLQFEQPAVISAGDRTLDQLTPQIQQSVLLALSARTLTLPVGQAMFLYRSKATVPSDSITIPRINTSARIIPMPSPVALIEKEAREGSSAAAAVPDRLEWPDFHAGVAAALQLRFGGAGSGDVSTSQISFNRPAGELDARHAGLLLGLGLSGQLGAMHSSQAYDYLKAKHDPTSVGVLLGLAVSYLGSSDPTVTSVVSIHLTALHPPRSSSLNVSGMTKSAAAVALGLLHFGTGRRSYADIMLREIARVKVTDLEDGSLCREAYALSCGFAFGFIMLGRGRDPPGSTAKEVELLSTFRALVLGMGSHSLPGLSVGGQTADAAPDVNVTSPAATVALALMYLRSERRDVADILELPDSLRTLDYVRADLLLLRTLARSLILWKSVDKSREWVERQVPAFLSEALAAAEGTRALDPDLDVARWSIIAGACFAIGFKFAGTATAEAHATLIHYLDRLTRASFVKTTTVQGKIKRHALRSSLGVVAIALSMVMAGTGELNVLRRLRVAHGMFSEGVTYGSHLATHMALGLLFLGQGKHTLGSSDAALAALLLSLYPAFPSTPTENRAHLQAYRHLWVLAVEPRYLEARDVDSDETVFLPVRLRLAAAQDEASVPSLPASSASAPTKAELRAKQLVAPTLLPNLSLIETIQVDSPRYWPFTLRLGGPSSASLADSARRNGASAHLARLLCDGTLYVKRRTGHLSYAHDPRGIRSIFTRSKSETGSVVLDFGETQRMLTPSASSSAGGGVGMGTSTSALEDFVRAFSGDPEALAVTQALCRSRWGPDGSSPLRPTAFEAFSASVLLECLTRDKRDIAGLYHALRDAWRALELATAAPHAHDRLLPLLKMHDLRFVVDFYQLGTFRALFGGGAGGGRSAAGPGSTRPTSSSGTASAAVAAATREPLLSRALIDHVASSLRAQGVAALSADPKTSVALATYLDSFEWPRYSGGAIAEAGNDHDARALALAIAHLRLLPRPSITTLKTLLAGSYHTDEEDVPAKLLAVRRTRLALAQQRGRASVWDEAADEWLVRARI